MIDYEGRIENLNREINIEIKIFDCIGYKKLYTDYKYIYVVQGKGQFKINEKIYELSENCLFSITPYTIVEVLSIKETFDLIFFNFNRTYINNIINNITSKKINLLSMMENVNLIKLKGKQGIKAKKILLEIRNEIGDNNTLEFSEINRKDSYSNLFVIAKFIEFLVLISRKIDEKEINNVNQEKQTLIKYMFAHSNEKLTINKLATMFFMSESTVRKYIYEFSGLTFNELLYKMRLQKTEDLLLYTNLNLDEIANLSGFVDGSHIIKIWNMKKNITPMKFKKLYKSFDGYSQEDKMIVFDIINYIKDSFYKEITIDMVVKKYKISEIKLNKLLLAYVDRNFSTYLNYIRINKACELLLNSDYSMLDICFKVGFNNVKSFNNNFKKIKNMTPTCYKENFKK